LQKLVEYVNNAKINPLDKIKISLLFALRYENDPYVKTVKTMCESNNMGVINLT